MNRRLHLRLPLRLAAAALLLTAAALAQDPAAVRPTPGRDADGRWYNSVIRLRPDAAQRYGGRTALTGIVETTGDPAVVLVEAADGGVTVVRSADIEMVETYARSFLPPSYNEAGRAPCCELRDRYAPWYFAELRSYGFLTSEKYLPYGIGMPRTTFGPELALGLRFGAVAAGLGAGWFKANDVNRTPLFLTGRWQLSCACLSPFVYAQAGTVFDDQSGVNALDPSAMTTTGPAVAGFGIGLDYAISPWNDISADIGYRYLHLPTLVRHVPAGQTATVESIFHSESHGLLLRVGWTF